MSLARDILFPNIEKINESFKDEFKSTEKEVGLICKAIVDLNKKAQDNPQANPVKAIAALNSLLERLKKLRNKVKSTHERNSELLSLFSQRVKFLADYDEDDENENDLSLTSSSSHSLSSKKRLRPNDNQVSLSPFVKPKSSMELYIMITSHLIRNGRIETAKQLVKSEPLLERLIDLEELISIAEIYNSLRIRNEATKALAWCQSNNAKLKKNKSTLECNLHLRCFFDIIDRHCTPVLEGGSMPSIPFEALNYAQKYLSNHADENYHQIKRAMMALIDPFGGDLDNDKNLVSWARLANQFRIESESLIGLDPLKSSFLIHVIVGLSAFKTRVCKRPQADLTASFHQQPSSSSPYHQPGYDKTRMKSLITATITCPVCDDTFSSTLIKNTPCVHHAHSTFICRISGEVMDENNPPMVLPNGQVYSKNTIQRLSSDPSSDSSSALITCPITGSVYPMSKARRAYLV